MTLYNARKTAREKLTEAQRGGDPAGERLRARGAPTVAELAEAYLERHARVHKRTARDDEQRIRDHLTPAFGSWKAETVGRADVARLHRRIGEKAPYAANRTLALVHHLFRWGEREGLLPEDHPNPARGVRRFREESRERWLSPAEVMGLLAALPREDGCPYVFPGRSPGTHLVNVEKAWQRARVTPQRRRARASTTSAARWARGSRRRAWGSPSSAPCSITRTRAPRLFTRGSPSRPAGRPSRSTASASSRWWATQLSPPPTRRRPSSCAVPRSRAPRRLLRDLGDPLEPIVTPKIPDASFYVWASPTEHPPFVRGTLFDSVPSFTSRSGFAVDSIELRLTKDSAFGAAEWRAAAFTLAT